MNVLHLLSSVSRANGGISESVRHLALAQAGQNDTRVEVLSLRDGFSEQDAPLWQPLTPRCLDVRGPSAWGYAPAMHAALLQSPTQVVHQAGLWMYPSWAQQRTAQRLRRPYVLSPHGMLDPWALHHSGWKKTIAAALFERTHLDHAACLHALCQAEADAMRAYGLRNPICVVPNGIQLPADSSPARPPAWVGRVPADRKIILFLGRIHPKKGLLALVQAWQALRDAPWHLVIAGWDQGGHQAEVEAEIQRLNLAGHIHFCGPLHGEAKQAAYRAAHGFVLPSYSEGLPMTVLEAWAHRKPVLMTAACNLPEGFAAGAACEISTDPAQLAQALLQFVQMPETEQSAVGERGRNLAEKTFNWSRIAAELLAVYRWVAGSGPQPVSVQN